MDLTTARILAQATGNFYRECAPSFSETRHGPWEGWQRLLAHIPGQGERADGTEGKRERGTPLAVLDVAAGNLRFARFLAAALPDTPISYFALDANAWLMQQGLHCFQDRAGGELLQLATLQELDAIACLLSGGDLARAIQAPACDLVVCFGFLHHVPGCEQRQDLLEVLASKLAPGGVLALSLWRFLDDERLAQKAARDHERGCEALGLVAGFDPAQLEEGDRLLGWQGRTDVFRYCHSFSDGEVDHLAATLGAGFPLVERFRADGASGKLNEYLVFRRCVP